MSHAVETADTARGTAAAAVGGGGAGGGWRSRDPHGDAWSRGTPLLESWRSRAMLARKEDLDLHEHPAANLWRSS